MGSMMSGHLVKTVLLSLSVFMSSFVPSLVFTPQPFLFQVQSIMKNSNSQCTSLGCTHYSERTNARNRSLRMRYLITKLQ